MKKKVLIVTKHPESKGGVVNYYNNVFKVFNDPKFQLEWFVIGSRPENYDKRQSRKLAYTIEFLKDIFKFISLLFKDKQIAIVQVSPSFMPVPIIRDVIYLFISKVFRKKTVTFVRGWSTKFEARVSLKSGLYRRIVKYYQKSDKVLVLAGKFKNVLIDLGFNTEKVVITRTMFLHKDIKESEKRESSSLRFLFIGRLSFQKGVIDIIEAIKILNHKGIKAEVELYGHFADESIKIASINKINDYDLKTQVKIRDFISGENKYKKLAESDVFLFPTYHDEGCPNSVIEALASGLFLISTPIGAIDEIVRDGKNGIIIPIKSPQILAEKMEWCINNIQLVRKIGKDNASYAKENFEQKIIMNQMHTLYYSIA
jgi:glycosyltransferase involved in cell wall biosynthesis